jgi:hypothetical protein
LLVLLIVGLAVTVTGLDDVGLAEDGIIDVGFWVGCFVSMIGICEGWLVGLNVTGFNVG